LIRTGTVPAGHGPLLTGLLLLFNRDCRSCKITSLIGAEGAGTGVVGVGAPPKSPPRRPVRDGNKLFNRLISISGGVGRGRGRVPLTGTGGTGAFPPMTSFKMFRRSRSTSGGVPAGLPGVTGGVAGGVFFRILMRARITPRLGLAPAPGSVLTGAQVMVGWGAHATAGAASW